MICLEASVAANLLLPESDSDRARALLTDTLAAGEQVIVPVLLFSEVTNILVQQVRRRALTVERGQTHLGEFFALPYNRYLHAGSLHPGHRGRRTLRHPLRLRRPVRWSGRAERECPLDG